MNQILNDIPVLPLRGVTIFPNMVMQFDIGRDKSVKAVKEAIKKDNLMVAISQKDASVEDIGEQDLYQVGTLVMIKQVTPVNENVFKVLVKGNARAKVLKLKVGDCIHAQIEVIEEQNTDLSTESEALLKSVVEEFEKYVQLNAKIGDDILYGILSLKDGMQIVDFIIGHIMLEVQKKQEVLECIDINERMYKTLEILKHEIEISNLQKNIYAKVKSNIDKTQKEYFLREQMKVISEQLGDLDSVQEDVKKYRNQLSREGIPEVVKEKVEKEIRRLLKTPSSSPESGTMRAYIETVLDIPWGNDTEENLNLKKAKGILEKEHYGLKEIKERTLEYLAVKNLMPNIAAPILCLVGPPGVGKTSIAKSIAHAASRSYVRISLGGIRDEAEIRGHRRTYIGAIPGRLVYGLIEAKAMNPVMLLDEVDKMSGDFRGDPASALLEILDENQNKAFRDHYLELPLDLSKVFFIATANNIQNIPKPLLDRMEIIELNSYTTLEKLEIGQKYLLPRELNKHALTHKNFKLSSNNMKYLIEHYTREAGVRNLERILAKLCRKAARDIVEKKLESIQMKPVQLEKYLGACRYEYEMCFQKPEIGVARGLAWTSVGGDTLSIEANLMKGKGTLQLTGKMGDVMKESAQAAISYIRSISEKLGINEKFYIEQDIHIHIPEGAVPKDGPSAGITMATAVISALTDKPVRADLAMTGEITIRGRVLAIGGLKEKLLAAKRARVTTVIVPEQNRSNIEELDQKISEGIEIIYAKTMEDVLKYAFA